MFFFSFSRFTLIWVWSCVKIAIFGGVPTHFLALHLESNNAKLPGTVYESPVYSNPLCNKKFVRIRIFPLLNLKNKCRNCSNPSNDFRVALCNCMPRYKWIISEKQQEKSLGLFLVSKKAWKFKEQSYNWVSYVLLSIQIDFQITTSNLKNEDTAKSHCFLCFLRIC